MTENPGTLRRENGRTAEDGLGAGPVRKNPSRQRERPLSRRLVVPVIKVCAVRFG